MSGVSEHGVAVAGWAMLGGVAALLVVLRWLPISASLIVGCLAGAAIWLIWT